VNSVEQLRPHVERAARHIAPALRRLGYEAEDCEQDGWLVIWPMLRDGTTVSPGLAYTLTRRAAVKAARRRLGAGLDGRQLVERVEDKNRSHVFTTELFDLIEEAPQDVRLYLGLRVLDGMTWDECRAALHVNNDTLAAYRTAASEWLLAQFEGRK
jgi:DNA-directed RNA polymerase specialized sigma24 family protein